MNNRRAAFWLLYLPPMFWLGAFFVVPLLLMAAFSLRADIRGELLQWWTPTLAQYQTLLTESGYWRLLGISAGMALASSPIIRAVGRLHTDVIALRVRAGLWG